MLSAGQSKQRCGTPVCRSWNSGLANYWLCPVLIARVIRSMHRVRCDVSLPAPKITRACICQPPVHIYVEHMANTAVATRAAGQGRESPERAT